MFGAAAPPRRPLGARVQPGPWPHGHGSMTKLRWPSPQCPVRSDSEHVSTGPFWTLTRIGLSYLLPQEEQAIS